MNDGPFEKYVANGWKLVYIEPGSKGATHKGWSSEENCIATFQHAQALESAGLAHAYSKTCAIDVDDLEFALAELNKHGVDLQALLDAPDAVRIERGDPNRTKLLYAVSEPLVTLKPFKGLELRCASRSGRTVQDVLPPSMHPSGEPYRWVYNNDLIADWSELPPLPDELRAFWESSLVPSVPAEAAQQADPDELGKLLQNLDPDTGYDQWVKVGMALHHASDGNDAGLQLWDQWSSQGEKYNGFHDLRPHWDSFQTGGDAPVTVNSLKGAQVASPTDFDDVTDLIGAPVEESPGFVHIAEWVKRPAPEWLIEGVLPKADIAMIYGASGSGKTFWALDLALTVASGRQWRENKTVQAPVAWIAAEAEGSVQKRALAYATEYGIDLAETELYVKGGVINLSQVQNVKDIIRDTLVIDPSIVVVDTLAAASGGANENSGEDMNSVLAACRAIHKATGALILLIHHSGKDASRGARGWSGIKAAVDTEIEIVEMSESSRSARITKQRDGEMGELFGFFLRPVDDSCVVDHTDYQPPAAKTGTPGIAPNNYMQEIVYAQALRMIPVDGSTVDVDELRDAAAEQLTYDGAGRDQRKTRIARCIDRMVLTGLFEKYGTDLVLPNVGFDNEGF